MIGKFPPIQGGISAKTYWMARGLAEKGVTVHVVTNANCVEEEYRIDDQGPDLSENLKVHYIDPDIPWHIPSSDLYVPRLLDKALEVVEDNHIDIIDTNYLIPYGVVGYLLSKITGIPYILRHGGSDIAKFLKPGVFSNLLPEVIRNASAIITDNENKKFFKDINSNIYTLPRYVPDERHFKPVAGSRGIPTFAYIGKINHYWKYKSLDKIVDIFAGIEEKHALSFVGQGKGFEEFSRFAQTCGLETHEFSKFVHPSNVPQLLGRIDYLLCFSQDNPTKDFSNILCEALWSGVTIITDKTMDINEYAQYTRGLPENQVIQLDTQDLRETQDKIKDLIHRWHGPERFNIEIEYGFNRYVEDNLKAYQDALASTP